MRIFKDLELVEQLGPGIPRILEYYGNGSFSFSDNFLRMTLVPKEAAKEVNEKAKEEGGVRGGATGGVIDTTDALTKRQKEVLKLIATSPSITYNEIAEALSINESTVGKHITAIKNKGFLVRQGGTQGYWEVNLEKNQ
ncbi:Winged helix-turn-helix DNA-binding protein [Gillisia limnaea]